METHIPRVLRFASDVGVVKETYKYEGEDIDEDIKELNRIEAEFGEEYKKSINNEGKETVVKVEKLDHIFPLEAVEKMTQIFENNGNMLD